MKIAKRILVTGSEGQVGAKLVSAFIERYGNNNVLSSDVRKASEVSAKKQYIQLDVLNKEQLGNVVKEFKPNQIVHLAAILSGKISQFSKSRGRGEEQPQLAMKINDTGVRNIFDIAMQQKLSVFIPSTIAAFGPNTPKKFTPDVTVTDPKTVYGITKIFMELLGSYYFRRHGLDFRSLRYPGVISSDPPGRGTTDCIIEMFEKAAENKPYQCFLTEHSELPMIHIDDLVNGTVKFIEADNNVLTDRVYNIGGFGVTPKQTEDAIKKKRPSFHATYVPDFRQAIADSWPGSINYVAASRDWRFHPKYKKIDDITEIMLKSFEERFKSQHS